MEQQPGARRHLLVAVLCYYLTSSVVFAGVWFGNDYLKPPHTGASSETTVIGALTNWDGDWYIRIARDGYFYDPSKPSSVAFFPAFPLARAAVTAITGLQAKISLVIVANIAFVFFLVVVHAYVCDRHRDQEQVRDFALWTIIAISLWPLSLFYRAAYSESLFALLIMLVLYGMQRNYSPAALALVIGLATACRPVGIALLPAFVVYVFERSESLRIRLLHLLLLPFCVWGLGAYMLYQQLAFDEPLAFVQTQDNWGLQKDFAWHDRLVRSLLLEPIWSKYNSDSEAWWGAHEMVPNPLFSLEFTNGLFVVVTAILVGVGYRKGWLNNRETILAATLVLIPYLAHGHRAAMLGQGRYAMSAIPAFFVIGRLLARLPPPIAALVTACSACLLGFLSALFAAWYRII